MRRWNSFLEIGFFIRSMWPVRFSAFFSFLFPSLYFFFSAAPIPFGTFSNTPFFVCRDLPLLPPCCVLGESLSYKFLFSPHTFSPPLAPLPAYPAFEYRSHATVKLLGSHVNCVRTALPSFPSSPFMPFVVSGDL